MKFLTMLAIVAGVLAITAAAQLHAQKACHVLDNLIGEWDWHQVPESDAASHGTFSSERELNGKATLLRLEWSSDKSKPPRRQLIVIYGNGQGKEKNARYFDDQGTASACSVENMEPQCGLTISCNSAAPPQYSFTIEDNEVYLAMSGKLAPWFRAKASRVVPEKAREP
jgi:hypothetical protein